jgi:hypothetical protein
MNPFAPDDIGPTIPYGLSPEQARCLFPLDEWSVLQQVELVDRPYIVTEHRVRKYLDLRIGRIVIVPLPVAVKAAGPVGPKLSAFGSPSRRRLPHIVRREERSKGAAGGGVTLRRLGSTCPYAPWCQLAPTR